MKDSEQQKFYSVDYLQTFTLEDNKYLIAKMFQDATSQFKVWLVPIMEATELLRKTKVGCLAFHRGLAISLGLQRKYWFEKLENEAKLLKAPGGFQNS